jgi:hypothetical protein
MRSIFEIHGETECDGFVGDGDFCAITAHVGCEHFSETIELEGSLEAIKDMLVSMLDYISQLENEKKLEDKETDKKNLPRTN